MLDLSFRHVPRLIVCAALLLALVPSLPAQQPLSLAEADARAQTLFQQCGRTGMILVVVRNHELLIKGYGTAAPATELKPAANSLIRLGSLSKLFTTDLLARLVADGKVALTDPLQRYAPNGIHVPTGNNGPPITLLNLATHTSGLPREVGPHPAKAPHYTFPDYKFRWDWLPKQKLITPPGTAALYSNIGFDLLADALASAAGKSYPQLLHERLLQPLGLWETTFFPTPGQCGRLLLPTRNQDLCTATDASPNGGLYTTPADMAKFLQYLLRIPGVPAPPAAELAIHLNPDQLKSVQGLNHAGEPTGIGLAWVQLGDPNTPSAILQKTGGGAGFYNYIALNPQRQTGIFLSVTDSDRDSQVDFLPESNNLLAALANVPPISPKARKHPPPARALDSRERPGLQVPSPAAPQTPSSGAPQVPASAPPQVPSPAAPQVPMRN